MASSIYQPILEEEASTTFRQDRTFSEEYDANSVPTSSLPPEKYVDEHILPPSTTNAFILRRPFLIYLQFIGPLFLLSLGSVTFIGYLHTHGQTPAPQTLADFSTDSPRITAQVVTVIATAFTATTRWALSGSATLLARKRFFQQYRPIFEIEHFTALRNIGIIWDWSHRKRMMFFTWLLVAMGGLLTSGFVALISPLPIAKTTKLSGGKELNLAADSEACLSWYKQARGKVEIDNGVAGVVSCKTMLKYKSLTYSSCNYDSEGIHAARAAALGYFAHSNHSSDPASFMSSFATLDNVRFLGQTAGTLPTGPAGVRVFPFPPEPTSAVFNYTLNLQGLWVEVDCQMNPNPPSNLTIKGTYQGAKPLVLNATCPENEDIHMTSRSVPNLYLRNGLLYTYYCIPPEWDRLTLYFRAFKNRKKEPALNAVDLLQCDIRPKVGNVEAILSSDLRGFIMRKQLDSVQPLSNLTKIIYEEMMWKTANDINNSQSEWGGNMWGSVIRWIAASLGGLDNWKNQDPSFLPVIEYALQGMFEYWASSHRLLLTATAEDSTPFPPECGREVKGEMTERLIGWNLQLSTMLALLPLLAITLTSTFMIGKALLADGKLTLFDPTNPVSLIAASSVGDVRFAHDLANPEDDIVGDPLDKVVGETRVAYIYHKDRWGLKSE